MDLERGISAHLKKALTANSKAVDGPPFRSWAPILKRGWLLFEKFRFITVEIDGFKNIERALFCHNGKIKAICM